MLIDSLSLSGKCSCGREHSMYTKCAVIESGCLVNFEEYIEKFKLSGKRCAVYGENSYAATSGLHPAAQQEIILRSEGLHANEVSTAYTLKELEPDIELLIAVGSGTVHDIVRFCAYKRGIPFVSVPTAASVDGFCSTVAAMTWYGFKKTLPAVAPEIVIADTDIIKNAPFELVKSGVGDILAKFTALADWSIAHELCGEYLCPRIRDIMKEAADTVVASVDGLIKGDVKAYEDVTYALIMSGLAMQMMGNSRPASGCEHHVSHLIEMEPDKLKASFAAMHGEKAGVGSLIGSAEYHKLAEFSDIAPYVRDYCDFDMAELKDFFGGSLAEAIINENSEDCLNKVSPDDFIRAWPRIREIISDIPTAEKMYSLLEKLDAKRSLEDIGVSADALPSILRFSPMVRNRLSLMRARRMLNI